jgi:hypothetical protein
MGDKMKQIIAVGLLLASTAFANQPQTIDVEQGYLHTTTCAILTSEAAAKTTDFEEKHMLEQAGRIFFLAGKKYGEALIKFHNKYKGSAVEDMNDVVSAHVLSQPQEFVDERIEACMTGFELYLEMQQDKKRSVPVI